MLAKEYKEYELEFARLDDSGDSKRDIINVMASDQTINDLMNNVYTFYEFLVDDGARFILSGESIGYLKEVVDGKRLYL